MHKIADKDVVLLQCPRTNSIYQRIRSRHYVQNKGTIGQQIHYLIVYKRKIIGIITGASPAYSIKTRDNFFNINKENKKAGLCGIVNNTVFRLEYHLPNLASKIIKVWRKRIREDWYYLYGINVHGYETFVESSDKRTGCVYKADNWIYLGETAGWSRSRPKGAKGKLKLSETTKKLIFVYKIPKTKLPTEVSSYWRLETDEDKKKAGLVNLRRKICYLETDKQLTKIQNKSLVGLL